MPSTREVTRETADISHGWMLRQRAIVKKSHRPRPPERAHSPAAHVGGSDIRGFERERVASETPAEDAPERGSRCRSARDELARAELEPGTAERRDQTDPGPGVEGR